MNNLQELYDYYIKTKPSAGKVRSATSLLIHICQALNIDAPEEVTSDMFDKIPSSIDLYYKSGAHKAFQDKCILAEMIGRYGPRDGWESVIDVLLDDGETNLQQFTLQSLEFYGLNNPLSILPYIIRYKTTENEEILNTVTKLVCRLLRTEHAETLKKELGKIPSSGHKAFLLGIKECIEQSKSDQLVSWFNSKFKL